MKRIFLPMHACFLIFLLLFPICHLDITPHSSNQYDAPFYFSTDSKSNHFFIYAEYVTSSSSDIVYSKYNIKFNPSSTSSVSSCSATTDSDLSEIFSSKTSSLTINLHSILSTEYIYYLKVGICSPSTSDIEIKINSSSTSLSCKRLPPSYVILTIQKQTGTSNIIITCTKTDNTINSIEIPISNDYEIKTVDVNDGMTNYILTVQILSKNKTFTRNGNSSCNKEGDNKCLEGYFCNENTCSKCHELCSECYASHLNSCTQCKIIDNDDQHTTSTECEINYIDMTQLGNIEIDITPPKAHRVTLGVWVFVPYVNELTTKPIHIALQDFVVISIQKSAQNNNKLAFFCTVNEAYYRSEVTESTDAIGDTQLDNIPNMLKRVEDSEISNGKWVYTECAMSFFHEQFYIKVNDNIERKTIEHEVFGADVANDSYFKNYYKQGDTTKLRILNAYGMVSTIPNQPKGKIYLRNIWVFSEYMPQDLKYYYHDLTKITETKKIKDLLFSLPLDKLFLPYLSPYIYAVEHSLNHYKKKVYVLKQPEASFAPARNLKRLKLLDANKKYRSETGTTDTTSTSTTALVDVNNNNFKCEDNSNKVIVGTSITTSTGTVISSPYICSNYCPDGYALLRLNDNSYNHCTLECSTSNNLSSCGGSASNLLPTTCISTFQNFHYKCLKEETPYHLYYSRAFKSSNFKITFKQSYSSYFMEIWYYPDQSSQYITISQLQSDRNYIFYSNAVRIYMDSDFNYYYAEVKQETPKQITTLDTTQWNKIVMNIIYLNKEYTVEFIINNEFIDNTKKVIFDHIKTNLDLTYILFAHNQAQYRDDSGQDTIKWASGYYKNLRVWDGTKAQPSVTENYDTIYDVTTSVNGVVLSLALSPLSMDAVTNTFKDTRTDLTGASPGETSEYVIEDTNPDFIETINYSSKFDQSPPCPNIANCEKCWQNGKCYKCLVGFKLIDSKCIGSGSSGSTGSAGGVSVYKNPNTNSEDVKSVVVPSFPKGTITMWIKPYGLKSAKGEMVTIGDYLLLYFNSKQTEIDFGLTLKYVVDINDPIIFASVSDFRNNFGKWTFISLAYWKGDNSYFPPMLNFEINSQSYPITASTIPDDIVIDHFTISSFFFGLIGGINYYKEYIIGAIASKRLGRVPTKSFFTPTPNTVGDCVDQSLFQTLFQTTFPHECVEDNEQVYNTNNGIDTTNHFYSFDTGIETPCHSSCEVCFGAETSLYDDDQSNLCSCYITDDKKRNIIIHKDNINHCNKLEYFNFGSCDDFELSLTPSTGITLQKQFTMHVWIWASDYISSNFKGFEIIWENHNTISISLEGTSDYYFNCYPDETNDTLSDSISININKWNFLSCAVNWDSTTNQVFTMQTLTEIKTTTLSTVTTPSNVINTPYKIHISDKGRTVEWGYLIFRQIRLWNEYISNSYSLARVDIKQFHLYPTLIHLFTPAYKDNQEIKDIITNKIGTLQCTIMLGVNAVKEEYYAKLALCGDDGQYYQENPEKCITFLNINNIVEANSVPDENTCIISVNEIEPSHTGSYSMAFWIFIDNVTQLSSITFKFEDHLQIKLTPNTTNTNNLDIYCYPQMHFKSYEYNQGIDTYSASGEWLWIICSVSHYDNKFYLNDKYFELQAELLYTDTINDYPYRYFFTDINKKTFSILLQEPNTAKIYLRTMYLFNDFIPYNYNIKYTDLTRIQGKLFNELLFAINYDKADKVVDSNDIWNGIVNIKYYTYTTKPDMQLTGNMQLEFKDNVSYSLPTNFKYVPVCDINEKLSTDTNDDGTKHCELVNTCVLNQVHAKLGCTDEKTPLICEDGYYMNINDNTKENKCEAGCNDDTFRLPGLTSVHLLNALCNSECPSNDKGSCPNKSKVELSGIKDYYTCNEGYSRINYKCIDDTIESQSAFYYSRCYNLPNIELTIGGTGSTEGCAVYTSNYIFEFWVMLDSLNFPKCVTNKNEVANVERYYVLYTIPHTIYYNKDDESFYYEYQGSIDSKQMIQINKYEWNRITITTDLQNMNVIIYNNYNLLGSEFHVEVLGGSLKGVSAIIFCSSPSTNCQNFLTTYDWYSAYYKNFRVWDASTTNIEIISAFGSGLFTKPTTNLVQFWPFTPKYIDNNEFKGGISLLTNQCNLKLNIDESIKYSPGVDETILYNYSSMFDWGNHHKGKFIDNITNNNEVQAINCYNGCSRCTSSNSDKCYECKDHYVLKGTQCNPISNYFVKLPLSNGNQLDLKTTNSTNGFDLSLAKAITISFYIKFFGNVNGAVSKNPEIISFSSTLKLYYDTLSTQTYLSLSAGQTCYFKDTSFQSYIGQWIPIIIVNYISGTNYNVYPNIFTLSVNNIDIKRQLPLPNEGLPITQLIFGSEIAALVGDLRIYNKAIQGVYNRIMLQDELSSIDLMLSIHMYGDTKTNCIDVGDLSVGDSGTIISYVECVGDYNKYLDPSHKCDSVNKYFDNSVDTCISCDVTSCVSGCYGESPKQCSCDLTEGIYWLREEPEDSYVEGKPKTFCEQIKYVDFSTLTPTSINVVSSSTGESTLEFWIYIYQYVGKTNFNQINLEWNKHNRVQITGTTVNCYPLVDIDDYTKFTTYRQSSLTFEAWHYIQCGTDLIQGNTFVRVGENYESTAVTLTIKREHVDKFLIYSSSNSLNNFGYVFIRQIKLWQQYNDKLIRTDNVYLSSYGNIIYNSGDTITSPLQPTSGNFPGLRALFENDFTTHQMLIEDKVTSNTVELTRRSDYIGYNVVTFNDKVLYCNENAYLKGEVCEPVTEDTKFPSCDISGSQGCIGCYASNGYLHPRTSQCTYTDPCEIGYYANDDIRECRPCHRTCYSCTGGQENNCELCQVQYYLVTEEHLCVTNCQDYGLVSQPASHYGNKCVEFDIIVKLKELSEDVAIDKKVFNQIEVELIGTTTLTLKYTWTFEEERTKEANNNDPTLILNQSGPFVNNLVNDLAVRVNPDFFMMGYKYTFCFTLSAVGGESLTLKNYFTFYINDRPYDGELIITPPNGLRNTTSFIFNCNNWKDDNFTMQVLEYKFYYIEENTSKEIIISNWTDNPEASALVDVKNFQQEKTKVTVYCEVRDEYHDMNVVTTELIIINDISSGHFTLVNALNTYTIPSNPNEVHLHVRSKLLRSLAIDPDKQIKPPFKISYFEPTLDQSEIVLNDPDCTANYCNNFGTCSLVDTFITCCCYVGYIGHNCQVDFNGYDGLIARYDELFTVIINKLITNAENSGLISSTMLQTVLLLFEGASFFYQDNSFFQIHLPELLTTISTYYTDDIIPIYFDFFFKLYEYYFTFLIKTLSSTKAHIKQNEALNERLIDINATDIIISYQEQFEFVIDNIDILIDTYISKSSLNQLSSTDIEFTSDMIYIKLLKVSHLTDINNIFEKRILNYKSYVNFNSCLSWYYNNTYSRNEYETIMAFIDYTPFPYLYNMSLYINNTSPLLSIRFYDIGTKTQININECKDDHSFLIYFPFNSITWLSEVNDQKHLYDPLNYHGEDDLIFNDPIFIYDNGFISNDTIEMRIDKYHRRHNITCNYYNINTSTFNESGMMYMNLTSDSNFIICGTSHLSRFTTFIIDNNMTFHTNERFFYLFRTQIFKYFPNYMNNVVFWIWVALMIVYVLFVVIFAIKEIKIYDNEGMLEFIKLEIIQNYFPYMDYTSDDVRKLIPNAFKAKTKGGVDAVNEKGFVIEDNEDDDDEDEVDVPKVVIKGIPLNLSKINNNVKKMKKKNDNNIDGINSVDSNPTSSRKMKKESSRDTGDETLKELNKQFKAKQINTVIEEDIITESNVISDKDNSISHDYDLKLSTMNNINLHTVNSKAANPPKKTKINNNDDPIDLTEPNEQQNDDINQTNQLQNTPMFISHEVALGPILKEPKSNNKNKKPLTKKELLKLQIKEAKELSKKHKAQKENELKSYLPSTLAKTLENYGLLQISACEFYCRNIKERHKFFNIFQKITLFHPRWKKLTLVYMEIFLIMISNTICLTFFGTVSIWPISSKFLKIALISISGSVFLMYPLSSFFITPQKNRDRLYTLITKGAELAVLKEWNKLTCRMRCQTICGMIVFIVIMVVAFYCSFGFTSVWSDERNTWVFLLVFCVLIVHTICEATIEAIVAVWFALKNKGKCCLRFGYCLNKMRSKRVLWP